KGLRLSLKAPSAPVVVGQRSTLTCTITSAEPTRVEVCILDGTEWTFIPRQARSGISILTFPDHPNCAAEFSLKPGEEYLWEPTVVVPDDARTGTLALKVTILRGPRNKR